MWHGGYLGNVGRGHQQILRNVKSPSQNELAASVGCSEQTELARNSRPVASGEGVAWLSGSCPTAHGAWPAVRWTRPRSNLTSEVAEAELGLPVGHAREHVPPDAQRDWPASLRQPKRKGYNLPHEQSGTKSPARLTAPAG
jgi:hypothetical protein